MKFEHSAGIIVYKIENHIIQYLLLHSARGFWDYAKGHLEDGETEEQAAERETLEETGLHATIEPDFRKKIEYSFKKGPDIIKKHVTFFIGHAHPGEIHLTEHDSYCWLPFDQAMRQLTFDNAKQLLLEANKYLLNKQ